MNNKENIAKLEILLFQYGELLPTIKIAKILKLNKNQCEELIVSYERALSEDQSRGFVLLKKGDQIQLSTKPELKEIIQQITEEEFKKELTAATLEVLTIIAYLGPISRMDIDYIRGVNSSFTVRNLMLRKLIERERKGNSYIYSIAIDFLKHLGLKNIEELPEYEKYKNILEQYEIK